MTDDGPLVYCIDADGRAYVIPADAIVSASGPPRHQVRTRDGRTHRLAT
jgi:hypothetical protein